MQRNRSVSALALFLAFSLIILGCAAPEPTDVKAEPGLGGIAISWSPVSGIAGYNIYGSTAQGQPGTKINGQLIVGQTNYVDKSVSDGVTYYYTVKAVDAGGSERGTAQASATARVAPPRNLDIRINYGARYTAGTSVSLSLSATNAKQCRFSNDKATWSDWEPYSTEKSWALSSGDGVKDVYYQCKDELGNIADPASSSINLDTTPPALSLTSPQQNGQYASSFDLIFTATDSISQTLTCTATLDGTIAYTAVVDASKQQKVTIHGEAGQHTLTLKCSDPVQSVNKSASFSLVNKPSVSIQIADGSGYTASPVVTISLSANLATECRLSNDERTWGDWQKYSPAVSWRLTYGEGTKTVYAQCRNANGDLSDTASDTIILDESPPPYMSVTINNDAQWTNSRYVTLGLYAFGAQECQYSNDKTVWTSWESYRTKKDWTLTDGTGMKTVYYTCRDKLGSTRGVASASISYTYMQPRAPTNLRISINNGASYTTSYTVSLQLNADYASTCRYRQGDGDWGPWYKYVTSDTYVLRAPDGSKTVYYQCMNDYGSNSASASIYLDTGPARPISDLNAQAGYSSISLTWSRPSDSGSGISYYEIFRATSGTGVPSLISTTTSTYYSDTQVVGGTTYTYYVRSRDMAGKESEDSNPASATARPSPPPPINPPSPITDLSAQAAIGLIVSLSWSQPSYVGSGIAAYEIFRSNEEFGMFTKIAETTDLSFTDKGMAAGTYAYSVRSKDTGGRESEDSNIAVVSVTPPALPPENSPPVGGMK